MSDNKQLAKELGSNKPIRRLIKKKCSGPLVFLNLVKLHERLVSRGGRPSDRQWRIKRLIPFKQKVWETLTILAKQCEVSPAQLAATIIERHIHEWR